MTNLLYPDTGHEAERIARLIIEIRMTERGVSSPPQSVNQMIATRHQPNSKGSAK